LRGDDREVNFTRGRDLVTVTSQQWIPATKDDPSYRQEPRRAGIISKGSAAVRPGSQLPDEHLSRVSLRHPQGQRARGAITAAGLRSLLIGDKCGTRITDDPSYRASNSSATFEHERTTRAKISRTCCS